MPPANARAATRPSDGPPVPDRPPKPTPLRPNFDRMPAELRDRARWVLWGYEWRDTKWTKPLYRADGHGYAASNRPETWATFEQARDAYERGVHDAAGVGWVVGEGVTGVDVDACRDPQTGALTDEAAALIAELRTYTEVSPSGTGVRAFAFGELPPKGRKRGGFEMYDGDGGRYLTVTGHQLDGTPDEPEHRTAELAAVHARHIARPAPKASTNGEHRPSRVGTTKGRHLTDAEVIATMTRVNAGAAKLWAGDLSGYVNPETGKPDHSRADAALAAHLGWATDYDAAQVHRLMAAWCRYRPEKWSRVGEQTVALAFEGHGPGDGYQPRPAAPAGELEARPPDPTDAEVNEGDAPPKVRARDVARSPKGTADTLTPKVDDELTWYADTDAGNAERFVHYTRGTVRYAPGMGWLLWMGTHWAHDPSELVLRFALDTIRATHATAALLDNPERRASLGKHARASEALGRLRAMLDLARVRPEVHVMPDELDADPWVLNTLTGLVDLRTATQRPHDPAALCTKLAPAAFDLDAEHEALDALLDVLDRDGRAEYIRDTAGQALTGHSAKAVHVWTGPSGTIKSTTADAIMAALGPYGVSVEPSTLIVSKHGASAGGARADLVALRGARLAVSAEMPNGGRLDSELVKRLTGRDPITARPPYAREALTFVPGHTLVMHSNHEPRVDWTDDGMRSRLTVVPFTVRPEKPDPRIRAALVEHPDARAAVLAWAAVGAARWYRNGERPPEAPDVVQARTRELWVNQDPFAVWAEDAVVFDAGPDTFTPTADLARSYQAWCEANGERAHSARALGQWLANNAEARKIAAAKRGKDGHRGWTGLRLRGPTG